MLLPEVGTQYCIWSSNMVAASQFSMLEVIDDGIEQGCSSGGAT